MTKQTDNPERAPGAQQSGLDSDAQIPDSGTALVFQAEPGSYTAVVTDVELTSGDYGPCFLLFLELDSGDPMRTYINIPDGVATGASRLGQVCAAFFGDDNRPTTVGKFMEAIVGLKAKVEVDHKPGSEWLSVSSWAAI